MKNKISDETELNEFNNLVDSIEKNLEAGQKTMEINERQMQAISAVRTRVKAKPAALLGKRGGQVKSEAKRRAVAENGKLGGRPRKSLSEKLIEESENEQGRNQK